MKKLIFSALTIGILTGCGGGGGGGGDSSPTPVTPTVYEQDGIYLNDTDLTLMIVDSDETLHGVIVGDYSNDSMYIVDSISSKDNTITTKGLTYVENGGGIYDPDIETSIVFNESGADISGLISGNSLLYSFDRTADSLPLADITGSHTNPNDGQEWIINADGSFTVNSAASIGCIITGNVAMVKGYYYRADNVNVTNCADNTMDGNGYTGIVATATQNGETHLVGTLSNGEVILWGSAPL